MERKARARRANFMLFVCIIKRINNIQNVINNINNHVKSVLILRAALPAKEALLEGILLIAYVCPQ